ncbi:unnamed protein product [Meganyctiphanes norvegica]|uniref:Uncharacterized protein n=1 Tax=Meganyctiphanes norvegica TaxID=48144 RepID=A0AAV2R1T3_MEGNR
MSSDVQAEVKDSVTTTCSVTTVEEESISLNISPNKEMTTVTTSNSGSNIISREVASIANLENCEEKSEIKDNIEGVCNGNIINQSIKFSSDKNSNCILKDSKKNICINKSRPTEYSDGLKVVYDMENSNPDIFFLPIPDPENAQLYRHSYDNSQAQERETGTGRWYSDSQLYVHKMAKDKAKVITSNAEKKLDVIDLSDRAASEVLRRCNSKKVLQALPKAEVINGHGHEGMFIDTESEGEDERKHRRAQNCWLSKERRFLSPTYSRAELEDWDLDLSSECLISNGGDMEVATEEHSEATSVSGAVHQGSVPSLQQEVTPDLEEDSNDFLWNGATYLKEDLLEGGELKDDPNHPNWSASSKKDLEHWHLTDKDHHQQHQVLLSPRSGCSDQPAERWSSSEQLSCCSEGFSVRSSDFENFCEQLCTLPELKRVSFCSTEAGGGGEGAASDGQVDDSKAEAAPSSNCSVEDGDEFGDDLNVDTVFTRDFYRLVKFESIKSLAASSKSLATNDGILTLEKLKDLEASGVKKETLASVLGFIAEQQKYCQEREAQDSALKPRDDPYRTLGATSSSELAKQAAMKNGAFLQNSPLNAVPKDSRSSLDRRTLPTKSKLASSACLSSNQASSSLVPSTSTTNSVQTPTPISSKSIPACTPTPAPRKVGPPVPAKPRSSAAQPQTPVRSNSFILRCPAPPCPPGYNRSSLPPPCSTQQPLPPPHRGQFPPRPTSMIGCHNAHSVLSSLPPPVPPPLVPPPPAALQQNSSRYSPSSFMLSDLYSVPPDEVFDMPPPPPSEIGSNLIPSCMLPDGPAPPVPRRSSSMGFGTQQGPPGSASGAPPVKPHLTNPNESPPVPKRVTSRALPPLPSEMMPGYPHLTPGSSHSLEIPRCSGVTSAETRRPLSFIKDTFGMGSPRRSSSDPQSLPGLSNQSPAGMLLELQRMAQVEEEEEEAVVKEISAASRTTMSKSDEHLYEPGSPVDNVGLGTGWVRVEPSHVDLQDPQARANLLDGMMESSEGCSSGTEDDDGSASATASNNPQHSQLRHLHRNRRKKKGLGQAQCITS